MKTTTRKIDLEFRNACLENDLKKIHTLHRRGACLDVRDGEGNTPLLKACANGYLKLVQLLVRLGAATNVRNNNGYTPFTLACLYNRPDVADYLMEHGISVARQNKFEPGELILRRHARYCA